MWSFKKKQKIPSNIFLKTLLQYLAESSPFLVFEELAKFGDLGVLGEEMVYKLEREIIYFSIYLQIHFTMLNPNGLNRTFDSEVVGEMVGDAVRKALLAAPAHITVNEADFFVRYQCYQKLKDTKSELGEEGSLSEAFAFTVLSIGHYGEKRDKAAMKDPALDEKLKILLPMGIWIYTTVQETVKKLLKDTVLC